MRFVCWIGRRKHRIGIAGAVAIALVACGGSPATSPNEDRRASAPFAAPVPDRTQNRAIGSDGGYNLERDEERGGHTLEKHVGRTDFELRERLKRERNISAASTWTDRITAEQTIA